MVVKRIYLDMDGVLADFNRGMEELLKLVPFEQGRGYNPEKNDELFEKMREYGHFYGDLKPIPGAKTFFDNVYERFGDRCEILTGIPKPRRGIVFAKEDKILWVNRFLSSDVVVHVVQREEKQNFCFGKDCVLVDDYENNIKQWVKRGGTGILFTNGEDVLKKIDDMRLE